MGDLIRTMQKVSHALANNQAPAGTCRLLTNHFDVDVE
jgi:hypothetical protein